VDPAALIEPITSWIADNPGWAGWLVFFIALGESLAIVGLFVPGAVLMFIVGALVGSQAMELWPTLVYAAAGAIAGDGISYWIGHHYHERLRKIWPFSRYPALIDKGEYFFRRHGGKGVLFGRFAGPVRPIIPVVAGMMDMPVWRFSIINVFSALLWAPAYILPGVVFSSSLSMATEVAGRLALLILLIFTLLLATFWLVRRALWLLQPRANPLISSILTWSRHHPLVGGVAEALLDPNHPEARGLAILSAILFSSVTVSVLLLAAVQESRLLGNMDLLIFNILQELRTPLADHVMVFITWFGDIYALGLILMAATGWLGWRRDWLAVSHLLAVAVCTEIMVLVLKAATAVERPLVIYQGLNAFSFPSGHTAASSAVYGMLAIIVAGSLPAARRWIAYSAAGVIAMLIGFSRLYLGAHWFSDVLGGVMLGVAWAALVGIAYRRHLSPAQIRSRIAAWHFSMVIAGTLLLAGLWGAIQMDQEAERYTPVRVLNYLNSDEWWKERWIELPSYRTDLRNLHNHPMTVQWMGSIDELRHHLEQENWRIPFSLDAGRALRLLAAEKDVKKLPVLPQVNDGRHEMLRMTHATGNTDLLLVLRLWPTDVVSVPGSVPLWQGNVSYLRFSRIAGLLTQGRTEADFIRPINDFLEYIHQDSGLSVKQVYREVNIPDSIAWDGRVILLQADKHPDPPAAVADQ